MRNSMSHRRWSYPLKVALFLCYNIHARATTDRWPIEIVTGGGSLDLDGAPYPGLVAGFGNHKGESLFLENLNLLLPPFNQSQLCEFPPEAWAIHVNTKNESDNNSSNTIQVDGIARDNMRVALFVSFGKCEPSQKVRVAAELQANYTHYGKLSHLVIYNNNMGNLDELSTLITFVNETAFKDISVVFVSTRSGQDILESIRLEESRQRIASPYLFDEGNEFWYYPVSFRDVQHQNLPGSNVSSTNEQGGHGYSSLDYTYNDGTLPPYNTRQPQDYYGPQESDDFYWFRLLVFCLLVLSPCFRAAYLWYAGGARIRFRYNEEGRVVGLQYIPPMPYWFSPRPEAAAPAPPANRMTEEEVMALPLVVFNAEWADQSTSVDDLEAQQQEQHPQRTALDENKNDDTANISTGQSTMSPLTTDVEFGVDHTKPPQEEYAPPRQPTCSICIDDFEDGERLRMLPRCRHIFHTDCILPWLTERQGCCPLCKTQVIEREQGEEYVRLAGNEGDTSVPAHMENGIDVASTDIVIPSTEQEQSPSSVPARTDGADTLCTRSTSCSSTDEEQNNQLSESEEVEEFFNEERWRVHGDDEVETFRNEERQAQPLYSCANDITSSMSSSVNALANSEQIDAIDGEPNEAETGNVPVHTNKL